MSFLPKSSERLAAPAGPTAPTPRHETRKNGQNKYSHSLETGSSESTHAVSLQTNSWVITGIRPCSADDSTACVNTATDTTVNPRHNVTIHEKLDSFQHMTPGNFPASTPGITRRGKHSGYFNLVMVIAASLFAQGNLFPGDFN